MKGWRDKGECEEEGMEVKEGWREGKKEGKDGKREVGKGEGIRVGVEGQVCGGKVREGERWWTRVKQKVRKRIEGVQVSDRVWIRREGSNVRLKLKIDLNTMLFYFTLSYFVTQ